MSSSNGFIVLAKHVFDGIAGVCSPPRSTKKGIIVRNSVFQMYIDARISGPKGIAHGSPSTVYFFLIF